MSIPDTNRMMMILSIIMRGKSKAYMEMLDAKNVRFHIQSVGFGTAPSEMMDIFGLGSNDKDIIISLAPAGVVNSLAGELGKNLDTNSRYGGLMMILSLSALNRLTAEILIRANREITEKGAENEMKSEYKHQLIMISVNQGYTDQVMQTAKKAGATGGTIMRARLAGSEKLQQFDAPDEAAEDEKEIIMILAPESIAAGIMTEVNREHGLKTDAKGIIWALPVDTAYKI
ncbi:MAG: hypothetical protein IJW40_06365 [Clostridia bacterium]|nr:hypothetical protein [Clostridia bacterium]